MPKRKCFFEEPPKNRICFRISTGDTTSSKTGIPFRSSACHRSHRGRDLPTVGERSGLVKTRTQGRAIGASAACCTCMAHHPVDNSILHGMRRFARRSWRSAKRAQAHATRPHLFRQHRTQHRTRTASVRPERTPFAIQRTHPSERTPLPSPSPRQSPTNFVVSTTYTHIHRTQAIHYEK